MTTRPLLLRSAPVAIVLAAIALAAVWWTVVRRETRPVGVVIITLDTTRADRLSPYGFMNVSLPHLERLAREGVVFDQATTVAPLTLPAHTSLFTGLRPPAHGVRDNADGALADAHTTLAETLFARGFRTGAFVGSVVLAPDRGLAQGFEQYRGVGEGTRDGPQARQRPANAVMDDAIGWLDSVGDSRFFLWTHLYDAHRPYDPPEPYRTTYGHNPYVGEIAFADAQIGRLLQALAARHLLDRTVVIVTADHGESLGEHGERDHGIFVYENVLRVPLIVRAPGLSAARVGDVVGLTDVMPTVLDLLGVPSPAADGVSLVNLLRGGRRPLDRPAYAESLYPERLGWSPLWALRDGRFKFIDAPRPELYDLEDDPVEAHNLYDAQRAMASTMAGRLATIIQSSAGPGAAQRPAASPELQARLGALGYVSSAIARTASEGSPLPDPKDCVGQDARAASAVLLRPPFCGPWPPADDSGATASARARPR
jgi:arylsulfatase A-like enzyme